MPRFRIQIEGSNIDIPRNDAQPQSEVIRGFFVTRIVSATDPEAAANQATAAVAFEWSNGQFKNLNMRPVLSVAEIRPAGLWEWLRARNTGYVFHPGS
jgi:hypothetical protein